MILTSPLGAVGFSVVHLAEGADIQEANRKLQLQDLVAEIKAASTTNTNFIVGDFNHVVSGSNDEGWNQFLLDQGALWMTGGAPCTGPRSAASLYGDIINMVEVPADPSKDWSLRPFQYLFDADAVGTPIDASGTMHVLGIAHSMLGALFKVGRLSPRYSVVIDKVQVFPAIVEVNYHVQNIGERPSAAALVASATVDGNVIGSCTPTPLGLLAPGDTAKCLSVLRIVKNTNGALAAGTHQLVVRAADGASATTSFVSK